MRKRYFSTGWVQATTQRFRDMEIDWLDRNQEFSKFFVTLKEFIQALLV
ncbi:MAG TPA: hypothetical protein VN946_17295 [Terriglobales bacterium]|nr:hypothetical protein [Terriglobales bacterium]